MPVPLPVRLDSGCVIGVDLGGTKTEVVALELEALDRDSAPTPRYRRRAPTPPSDYAGTVALIAELVAAAAAATGGAPILGVGLGTPGATSRRDGRMKNSNSQVLNGRPLYQDVAAAVGLPVTIANDANCFALAEATFGAGRGAEVVAGIILGTGMGGGIVVRGQVHEGPQGIAGEWGHLAIDPRGPACNCGQRGCLETVLSGSGMERRYLAATGQTLPAAAIWAAAEDPADPAHRASAAACEEYLGWFGRGLASILNVLDPDVVVLGGGLSQVARLYREGPARVRAHLFSDELTTPIRPPLLGDAAGVFGAALLAARAGHTPVGDQGAAARSRRSRNEK
jgi:predicted NBD/HSP70 family sugar kinase